MSRARSLSLHHAIKLTKAMFEGGACASPGRRSRHDAMCRLE